MNGQMMTFPGNGQQYDGYLSKPATGGPGVLVIQEWWGLNDHIKSVCDRLAAEGFTAFAPDLYHGQKTTSPDEAGKLMMALNIAEAEKIIRGAIHTLLQNSAGKTVGTIGFCMGGQLSLYAAATNPDKVSACVNFYGIHPNVHPPFENLQAPVLGHFAENDSFVNAEAVESLRGNLQKHGKQHEFHLYKGVDHAFFNDTRPAYDQESAELAWRRTLEFLTKNIS